MDSMAQNSQQSPDNPPIPGGMSAAYGASRKRHVFLLLSVIIYIISFIILFKWKNFGMGVVAIIPVITAAWIYGTVGGFLAGLLSLASNIVIGQIIGIDWYVRIIKTGAGFEGTASLIVIGVIVGRISDLSRRLKKELSEKERIEHELERHRQSLEGMVEQKTAELSAALEEKTVSNSELLARERELVASEKRFRSVIETAVDAIITANSAGQIIDWNRAAEKIYGYTANEIVGKPVSTIVPERFRARDSNYIAEAIRRQEKENVVYTHAEVYGLKKDGSEFPIEVSQSVWQAGDEIFATGIVRDITERQRADAGLHESEERLRAVVDGAVDAIVTTNTDGQIMGWNKGAEKMFGYTAEEIISKPVNMLIPERVHFPDMQAWRQAMLKAYERMDLKRREGMACRKDGVEFPVEISQSLWKSGDTVFATGIIRDITESKKAQDALQESQARLRSIVDSAPDAIITADSTGTIVFWNKGAEKIYGYTAAEIIGKNVGLILPQRMHPREQEFLSGAFHHQGIQELNESISLKKDGAEFPVEVTRALWSAGGSMFATAIVRDITERKKGKHDRLLLSSVIEQAHENILIMDAGGTILYVNPAVVNLMGRPAAEILGANGFQASGSTYDALSFQTILKQLQSGSAWTEVLNYKIGNGKTSSIEQTLSPILDADGKLMNILSISRDISHEQYLEEQLRQSQKMEAIGTLAGGIAHDFNNILAAILGYTELAMLDMPKDSITAERLNLVISSCDRARSLVKQILTFSRKSRKEAGPFRLSSIVKEVIKLLRASLPSTIEIQQNIRDADAVVKADPTQLHQLIINLCTNAAQAMEASGGLLTIGLEACIRTTDDMKGFYDLPPGAYVRMTVRDTGPGIEPDIRERIFEPFFTTKDVGKGTGMGLAVAHGIATSYGGCIYVDSQPGEGAAFHVLLPRIEEEMPKADVQQPAAIPRGSGAILFVDDEETVMHIGHNMLESLGYTVFSTSSSEQAIEMFRAAPGRFDCVITDMTMPHIRGDELARRLLELRPGLPIILCTGFSEKISEEQALNMGIRAFLLKPYNMQELGLAVRKALESRQ
jgi:PAS domain S-box-containing protein